MESFQLWIFAIIWSTAFLLTRVGLAVLFKKAGVAPWLAFIPVLSWWYWIKIVDRPKWYMIGMVIPCINILFSFNITLDLLRSFGQHKLWQHFAGTVLTFFYLPYLAFRKDTVYLGGAGKAEWRKKNIPDNNGIREWGDAFLFAMYIAGGMRSLYFDLYQIPTPSMEANLMVGDFLVVSRAKVGMRIPMTPIAIPVLAHKELLGMQAYTSILELPYMRLPGWYTIQRNDVIVFNYPADDDKCPVDKRENYVKRCVGIPGDSLIVVDGQVYNNGKALPAKLRQQNRYLIRLKGPITSYFLREYELWVCDPVILDPSEQTAVVNSYFIHTWKSNAQKLAKDPYVTQIFKDTTVGFGHYGAFIDSSYIHGKWVRSELDNFGPIYLPKRGDVITLNRRNWNIYKLAINKYENSNVIEEGGKFYVGSNEVSSYTFKYGYYWMMGDNRYNSLDSRFWGYVPEDHIVGKPLFTFFSIKKLQKVENGLPLLIEGGNVPHDTKFDGIRWEKIFRRIE